MASKSHLTVIFCRRYQRGFEKATECLIDINRCAFVYEDRYSHMKSPILDIDIAGCAFVYAICDPSSAYIKALRDGASGARPGKMNRETQCHSPLRIKRQRETTCHWNAQPHGCKRASRR